jgi:hypothetical protein
MTAFTLEQIKSTVPYTVSQKPWYKEYPFRVGFHGWDLFAAVNDISECKTLHRQIRKTLKSHSIDYRKRDDTNYYIYLKTSSDVSLMIELFTKHIIDVAGPYSEKHKNAMLSDFTLLVKDKLWYNQYRYKVSFRLRRNDMDFLEEIAEFVTDNFEHGTYKLNSVICEYPRLKLITQGRNQRASVATWYYPTNTMPYVSTGTVYLKNYEDLCTIHMMHKSTITETVKIVLTHEIE